MKQHVNKNVDPIIQTESVMPDDATQKALIEKLNTLGSSVFDRLFPTPEMKEAVRHRKESLEIISATNIEKQRLMGQFHIKALKLSLIHI